MLRCQRLGVIALAASTLLFGGCSGDPRARQLCEAISRSDVAGVEQVLRAGAVDLLNDSGGCIPARDGFIKADSDDGARIAGALLTRGLDANTTVLLPGRSRGPAESSARGLVELAAAHGRAELIQALIQRGLQIKQRSVGLAVLRAAQAGHLEAVNALVGAGAAVNEPLGDSTALGQAIRYRRHAVIRRLDQLGARESVKEQPALFRAARSGNLPALKEALAEGTPVDSLDVEGETPLVRAAAFGQVPALEMLLAAGAQIDRMPVDGTSALHAAVSEGQHAAARTLLEKGARVEIQFDAHSVTPLVLALRRRDVEMVGILVAAGADATRLGADGDSPLRQAVQARDLALTQALLRGKGDVNQRPASGWPLLHLAISGCESPDFDLPLLRALIAAGARLDAKNEEGLTAGQRAARLAAEETRPFYRACHQARAELLGH